MDIEKRIKELEQQRDKELLNIEEIRLNKRQTTHSKIKSRYNNKINCLKKYGVENIMHLPENKEKQKKAVNKAYTDERRKKLSESSKKSWTKERRKQNGEMTRERRADPKVKEIYSKKAKDRYQNKDFKKKHKNGVKRVTQTAQWKEKQRRASQEAGKKRRITQQNIIDRFIARHGDRYDYSKVVYSGIDKKVIIGCSIHGQFKQSPSNHLKSNGCQRCKMSYGEYRIEAFLKKSNINHICEYKFKDCIHIKPLPFDFYLPDLNACIEFDGIQHFKVVKYYKGTRGKLEEQQRRDNIKTDYCKHNDIKLIRISYLDVNNIENILNKEIG